MHNEGAFYAPNGVTGNAAAAAEMERSEKDHMCKKPLKNSSNGAGVCRKMFRKLYNQAKCG